MNQIKVNFPENMVNKKNSREIKIITFFSSGSASVLIIRVRYQRRRRFK